MSVIPFNLSLQAAEGVPAVEPNCTIRFARTTDDIVILEEQHVVFPPAQQFSVPAWPQEQSLTCEILPSLYRVVQSQMFAPTPQLPANHTVIVLRDPAKWAPDFV